MSSCTVLLIFSSVLLTTSASSQHYSAYGDPDTKSYPFSIDCSSTSLPSVEKAICLALDKKGPCGELQRMTLMPLISESVCNLKCSEVLDDLFDAYNVGVINREQIEIVAVVAGNLARAHCKYCRPLCWMLSWSLF